MKRKGTLGLVALTAILLALFVMATPALAADLRSADSVIVASGDVVNDDLYAAGSRIVINGTVNGDLIAAGDTILVNGKIDGSIIAAGANININGEVTRSVRVAGSKISIAGSIGGDLAVAGGDIDVSETAQIGRDVLFRAGNIRIRGPVGGDVKGGGGEVMLAGEVQGDVEVSVEPFPASWMVDTGENGAYGRLVIEPTARIHGNFIYTSQNEVTVPAGASIEGQTTHKLPPVREPIIPALKVWARVLGYLMTLVAGIVLVLVFPKRSLAAAASIKRRPLPSLGWGALIFFVTPLALLIILITIVGIPISLIGLAFYLMALFVSQIVVGLFIGYLIIGSFSKVESRGMLVAALALGFTILTLVKLIPYLGIPIWIATVLFGIGAMAVSRKTLKEMESVETV